MMIPSHLNLPDHPDLESVFETDKVVPSYKLAYNLILQQWKIHS